MSRDDEYKITDACNNYIRSAMDINAATKQPELFSLIIRNLKNSRIAALPFGDKKMSCGHKVGINLNIN